MIKAADLQYVLNTMPMAGYAKAFRLDQTFINRVGIRPGKAKIEIPINYAGNSTAGSFGEDDNINDTGKQSRKMISFPYKRVRVTIGADGLQEAIAKNGGVINMNDLIQDELMNGMKDLLDEINTQTLGDGTGNSGKDIQGLQYHIADSGNYGNEALSRATYPWLQSYVNDNGGTLRDLTQPLMDTVKNTMKDTRKANYTAIWAGPAMVDAYRNLMAEKIRYTSTKNGDLIMDSPLYDGRPLIEVPGYPSGRMDFVQEGDFELWYLPHAALDSKGRVNKGMFKVEPLAQTTDSSAFVVIAYVALVCKDAWKQGSLQDLQ